MHQTSVFGINWVELVRPFDVRRAFFVGTLVDVYARVIALYLSRIHERGDNAMTVMVNGHDNRNQGQSAILCYVDGSVARDLLMIVNGLLRMQDRRRIDSLQVFNVDVNSFLRRLHASSTTDARGLHSFAMIRVPIMLFEHDARLERTLDMEGSFTGVRHATGFFSRLDLITY